MTKGKQWEFRPQRRWYWAVLHIGHILVNNNIFDLCHLKLNGDSPENGPPWKRSCNPSRKKVASSSTSDERWRSWRSRKQCFQKNGKKWLRLASPSHTDGASSVSVAKDIRSRSYLVVRMLQLRGAWKAWSFAKLGTLEQFRPKPIRVCGALRGSPVLRLSRKCAL